MKEGTLTPAGGSVHEEVHAEFVPACGDGRVVPFLAAQDEPSSSGWFGSADREWIDGMVVHERLELSFKCL